MILKHYAHAILQLTDGYISILLFLLPATVPVSAESYCYYTVSFRLRPKEANRPFFALQQSVVTVASDLGYSGNNLKVNKHT